MPPFIPDSQTYRTRPIRAEHHYAPYYSRPTVTYNDPFGSFFWWWLLDRSLNERALWAYHHQSDMDRSRYQALLASDTNLEARIKQLEAERTPVDTNYVPAGLDRDLMYSDEQVRRAYAARPTAPGRILFWIVLVPTAAGIAWFLVWLVFCKRWQTAPQKLRV